MFSNNLFVTVGPGLQLRYVECGSGQPVIFIHGSGPGASGMSNFADNMTVFAANGYRAIAYDLFGFGESSKPTDRKYDLALQISGLKALVDSLKVPKVFLVGNSLGGAVAMGFTLAYPELVEKLILMAPGGLDNKLRYLRMPGIRAMMWAMLGPGGPTLEKLTKVFSLQVVDPSIISDALIAERFAVAKTQPKHVYKTLSITNLSKQVHKITCPTLVFWGMQDNFCPVESASLLATEIKNCRAILVAQCGHWVQVEHPTVFNAESLLFLGGESK